MKPAGPAQQDQQQHGDPLPVPPGKWNETAERLLEAARRVLETSGFNALSLERVAQEAGVNKPLIFYYFGNKAGLLRAVMDSVLQQDVEKLRQVYADLPEGEARVRAVVDDSRRAAADQDTNRVFFDTAVNMLRHAGDRGRLAAWCATCRQINMWGLAGEDERAPAADIEVLSAMTLALQDGLALQVLADPEAVDTDRAWSLWQAFLSAAMRRLRDEPSSPY